jgi:hypothetical protein
VDHIVKADKKLLTNLLRCLGQPEKALGHEPQIDPWLTHRTTAGLPSLNRRVASSPPEERATKMANKINQAVRGTQEASVFHRSGGWKSSNLSPLPVEGEIFSLTFPFIDQAITLKTGLLVKSRVESRAGAVALASRWLLGCFRMTRLNPVWRNSVSCSPGGAVARTGLRMMPTFPLLPLKFRRADLLRYGFKAGLSNGAFPSISEVFASCGLHPSFVPIACRSKSSY